MANTHNLILVTHDETSANDQRDLYAELGYRELAGLKIRDWIKKVTSGSHPAKVYTKINAAKATGTVTLASHVAADTVTLGGTVLTAIASGANANQYNIGADDTATAVNLAAAINAHTTIGTMVEATSALAVVTITPLIAGAMGNQFTLAISAHGSVSGAKLTGGTNGDTETVHYFGSGT